MTKVRKKSNLTIMTVFGIVNRMIINVIFFGLMAVSAYTDLRRRKVFNSVTFPAMVLGLGLNIFYFGASGLVDSLSGIAVGFIFLAPFYFLGGMGAGDVKFMMAVGALKGLKFTIVGGFYGAIIGGIAAVIVIMYERHLISTLKKVFKGLYLLAAFKTKESITFDPENSTHLPYTVFLAMGFIIHFLTDVTHFR